ASAARFARRSRHHVVRQHRERAATRQGRTVTRLRRHLGQALGGGARSADDGRVWLSGLRSRAVVRTSGARRNVASDHRQGASRHGANPGDARRAQEAERPRARRDRRLALGARGRHPARDPAVGEGDQGRWNQGERVTYGETLMPHLLRHLLGLLLAIAASVAAAQGYPAKPLRLIIPFSPGGSNDIVGRMAAAQLGERLGQPVIVDNRTGAGGTIGTEAAAKASPDGYTLFLVSVAHAFNTAIYKKLPYDPVKSFVPVAMLGTGPAVLVVYPGLPANSLQELIALAKQKPGQLNYASAGVGSFLHLAAELFRLQAGISLTHVPYKGAAPATVDVIAGQAQLCVASIITLPPHLP